MGTSGNPAKRAEKVTEPTVDPATYTDAEGVEDFDLFWTAQDRKGHRLRIRGEVVELPASLPLRFEMEARRLQRSKRAEDISKLVGLLFGEGRLEAWTEAGMGTEEFAVLLAYAPQKVAGKDVSLAEVAAKVRENLAREAAGMPDPLA